MLRDASQKDAPGVRFPVLRPLSNQRLEVAEVECHRDSLFLSSQREHVGVVDTLEVAALIEREHVVSQYPQLLGDHPAGDMRVEDEAQVGAKAASAQQLPGSST